MKNQLIYNLVDKFLMNDFSKVISEKVNAYNKENTTILK